MCNFTDFGQIAVSLGLGKLGRFCMKSGGVGWLIIGIKFDGFGIIVVASSTMQSILLPYFMLIPVYNVDSYHRIPTIWYIYLNTSIH